VNVPYALITTSVSADLGTRLPSSKALATITSILDGTGSIGTNNENIICIAPEYIK